jgi:hypothetical protein
MWRPWLKFLKGTLWPRFCCLNITHYLSEFPRAWEVDAAFELPKATESDSDEEDEDSDTEDNSKQQPAAPVAQGGRSPGFEDFLRFLELGCGGSPLPGYPAVLAFLHSIPSSVRAQPAILPCSVVMLNCFLRSYSTPTLTSPPAHSSPHSGPPSTVAHLVPSIVPPSPPRSLELCLSALRSWRDACAVLATAWETLCTMMMRQRHSCVRSMRGCWRKARRGDSESRKASPENWSQRVWSH